MESKDKNTHKNMHIIYKILMLLTSWLAGLLGMRLVAQEAVLLPKNWLMFDPALADEIGINKAIIVQKVDGWIQSNIKRGHNIIAGRAWSYNTIPEWHNVFCWLSKNYVGDLLRQLEREGRLVSDHLNPNPQVRTKYYSTPTGDLTPRQIGLWESENPTLSDEKVGDDSSIGNQTISPSSIQKKQQQPRARKPVSSGAVADFKYHNLAKQERPEYKTEMPEAHADPGGEEGREWDGKAPPPVPPTPSPIVPAWMPTFFTGCKPAELVQILHEFDEPTLLAAKAYAENKANHVDNPPGFVRAQLKSGWRPPAGQGVGQSYVSGELAAFIEH